MLMEDQPLRHALGDGARSVWSNNHSALFGPGGTIMPAGAHGLDDESWGYDSEGGFDAWAYALAVSGVPVFAEASDGASVDSLCDLEHCSLADLFHDPVAIAPTAASPGAEDEEEEEEDVLPVLEEDDDLDP